MTSLFIFTRDLRLDDNLALIDALRSSNRVLPVFIFDKNQITSANKYKSNNCVQFMIESLDDLDSSLRKKGSRLFYFYGSYEKTVRKILSSASKLDIRFIHISRDYTPFAKKREKILEHICKEKEIELRVIENHMLTGVDAVLKDNGSPYVKFTPYYRAAKKVQIARPIKNNSRNYVSKDKKLTGEYKKDIHKFYKENDKVLVRGGRKNALTILKRIKNYKNYNVEREIPSHQGTTRLSAYLKFNAVSVREVYYHFKKHLSSQNKLFTQLYWRDFYMQIMNHFDVIKHPMNDKDIKWDNNPSYIKKWKEGKTGIPIVDAGMRELVTCGWQHNRLRMIVSNFLIKILRCDWMIGEKFFAQNLIDYDPANNNGGWQWSSSTGVDSMPYFRVFNPWRQAEKHDPECVYIKKWLPELKDVPIKDILKWDEKYEDYKHVNYPKPIVEDIQEEFQKTLKLYRK